MPQKILYLCQDCSAELVNNSNQPPSKCIFCGSEKFYKSHHHQRAAKKSKSKERWSYRVK